MGVQENIKTKEMALNKLIDHCLCASISGDIVYLPSGYGIDAIRISETTLGYDNAYTYLEYVWQKSMWWKN